MNVLHSALNNPTVLIWGWVLVHFLWQGAIVTLIAWLMLSLFSRSSAQVRYLIGIGCLSVAAICPLLTWFSLAPANSVTSLPTSMPIPSGSKTVPHQGSLLVPKSVAFERVENSSIVPEQQLAKNRNWQDRLELALPWIVSAWFVGVLLLSIRLLGGGWIAHRFISQAEPLQAEWPSVVKRLLEQIQLSKAIRCLQSSQIQVPQMIGWWKPVVLVPTSMMTTLTPQEIECVLIHELAHIRRHDFVINLFQCIIETFFFFHPCVWWLSRRIRLERELACDETVVKITGDPVTFSRALLALADLTQLSQPTLAATGGDLSKRIHAVLGMRRAGTSQNWLVLLCVAVCITVVGAVVLAKQPQSKSDSKPERVTKTESASAITRFVKEGLLVPDISGVVLDESGKPVPDAVVYLRQNSRGSHHSGGPVIWKDLARMKSDSQGRFQFSKVLDDDTNFVAPAFDIVAFKENYSLGWKHIRPQPSGATLKVTLKQPAKISGRIVDESGEPVAGANVLLKHLMSIRHITQADLEEGRWPKWSDPKYISLHGFRKAPSTVTDAKGRFQLVGAVADSGAFLQIAHPNYQLQNAYAATVSKLEAETASKMKRHVQTGEISITLKRGYQLKIRVLDNETGKPILNARHTWNRQNYHLSPQYRVGASTLYINHLSSPQYQATVYPPEQTDYLAYRHLFLWPDDQYVREVEVRLKKGITVRGRVIDDKGQGIAGVNVFVKGKGSLPLPLNSKNLHLISPQPLVTNEQGEFTAILLPGDYSFVPRDNTRRFVVPHDSVSNNHMITVTEAGTEQQPVLKLSPTPRFQFVVTDPEGNPAPNINIFAQAHSSLNHSFPIRGKTNEEGKYLLDQLFLENASVQDIFGEEVVFRDRENKMGARLILKRPKQGDPIQKTIDVRLEKLGTVKGRTVSKETGKPIAGTTIWLYKQDHYKNTASPTGAFAKTDSNGRFELKGVLRDVEHHLWMKHTRYKTPNGIHTRFHLNETGVVDFGDLRLNPLSRLHAPKLAAVVAPNVAALSLNQAFQKLESNYKTAFTHYRNEFDSLRKKYSSSEIVTQREPTPVYCQAFLKLAERSPKSDIALQSYLSVINSHRIAGSQKKCQVYRAKASEAIVEHFLDRAEIADCIHVAVAGLLDKPLRNLPSDNERVISAAEKLMKQNSHRSVHARTCYYLVERLMDSVLDHSGYPLWSVSPKTVEQCQHYLDRLKNEFPEYDHFLYGTYQKAAERLLYDLEHLLVGKTPPDLVGTDVLGKQVKLSDFRGKLVIVDFWEGGAPATHDSHSLRQMIDKAGDQITAFGIVSSSQAEVLADIKKFKITYPVFADGKKGPFFTKWNIHSWPTTFLLDEQGTILYRGQRGTVLDNILIKKLAEKTR